MATIIFEATRPEEAPVLEEIFGVPTHPLVVHAPVVFVPLLALLAAAYAVAPFVRPHVRWVLALLALATPFAALAAKATGHELFRRLDSAGGITTDFYPKLESHENFGNQTLFSTIALAVLALALVYFVAPRGATPSAIAGRGAGSGKVLPLVLGGLSLVAAGVSMYFVIRSGHSGSEAAWSGR